MSCVSPCVSTFSHLVLTTSEMRLLSAFHRNSLNAAVICPQTECASSEARDLNTGPLHHVLRVLGALGMDTVPGWDWGHDRSSWACSEERCHLPLTGSGCWDAGPQLTGTSVWSWGCVFGSYSEITGPNSQMSLCWVFLFALFL